MNDNPLTSTLDIERQCLRVTTSLCPRRHEVMSRCPSSNETDAAPSMSARRNCPKRLPRRSRPMSSKSCGAMRAGSRRMN